MYIKEEKLAELAGARMPLSAVGLNPGTQELRVEWIEPEWSNHSPRLAVVPWKKVGGEKPFPTTVRKVGDEFELA